MTTGFDIEWLEIISKLDEDDVEALEVEFEGETKVVVLHPDRYNELLKHEAAQTIEYWGIPEGASASN